MAHPVGKNVVSVFKVYSQRLDAQRKRSTSATKNADGNPNAEKYKVIF